MKIGERIRRQRKKLGLSLRELGARTDLTAGFLSQIENEQLSPSLNSLQSIATALQVPMFYFLEDGQPSQVVRADKRRALYFPDSQIGYELLSPDLTRRMMPLLIRLQPGSRRIALPLAKPTEQWMFVVKGKMEIKVGDETLVVDQGDCIYFDGDLLREFAPIGDQELEVICCMMPPAL